MSRLRLKGLLYIISLPFLYSCGNRQQIVDFNPKTLYDAVMWIDSINNDIIDQLSDDVPSAINPQTGSPYSVQEIKAARAVASKDWAKFLKLIKNKKYQRASQFILETNNRGSILGHIRDSELRTQFIMDVVKTLLLEYQEDNYLSCYLEWLDDEVLTEMFINGIKDGLPHNMAGTFPDLLLDYGITLSRAGYIDDALDLLPYYYQANVYLYPDNELYSLFCMAFLKSSIYYLSGDNEKRDAVIQDFKDNIMPIYEDKEGQVKRNLEELESYWAEQE